MNPLDGGNILGFHWEWLAIRRTEPNLAARLFEFTGFPAKRVVAGLTFGEALKLIDEYMVGRSDSAAACDFEGWTMVRGSAVLAGKSAAGVAKLFDTDVCHAYAESTTWALGMEYGRPDGTLRRRTFLPAGDPTDVGVAQVRDSTGKVIGWNLAPKALIGPDGRARQPEEAGKEEVEGTPLPAEPVGIRISDDTKLLQVLTAVGVPVERVETHYGGSFDYARKILVPGKGANEKVFTFYGLGDAPAPRPAQGPAPKPERQGLFRRFRE